MTTWSANPTMLVIVFLSRGESFAATAFASLTAPRRRRMNFFAINEFPNDEFTTTAQRAQRGQRTKAKSDWKVHSSCPLCRRGEEIVTYSRRIHSPGRRFD